MYWEIGKTIEQPTDMNNKIILFTELVSAKLDEYVDKMISDTAFGRTGDKYANLSNDFIYLLGHLLNAYYYMETQINAGETYGEDEVYSDYGLENIREYFMKTHSYDIVPLYDVFGLTDNDCDSNTLFGTAIDYIDLDCLIPN